MTRYDDCGGDVGSGVREVEGPVLNLWVVVSDTISIPSFFFFFFLLKSFAVKPA